MLCFWFRVGRQTDVAIKSSDLYWRLLCISALSSWHVHTINPECFLWIVACRPVSEAGSEWEGEIRGDRRGKGGWYRGRGVPWAASLPLPPMFSPLGDAKACMLLALSHANLTACNCSGNSKIASLKDTLLTEASFSIHLFKNNGHLEHGCNLEWVPWTVTRQIQSGKTVKNHV